MTTHSLNIAFSLESVSLYGAISDLGLLKTQPAGQIPVSRLVDLNGNTVQSWWYQRLWRADFNTYPARERPLATTTSLTSQQHLHTGVSLDLSMRWYHRPCFVENTHRPVRYSQSRGLWIMTSQWTRPCHEVVPLSFDALNSSLGQRAAQRPELANPFTSLDHALL